MIPLGLSDRTFIHLARGGREYVPFLKDVPMFRSIPLGWILHVAQGDGDLHTMFSRNVPGSRKFSHLWVAKNGAIRMYGNLNRESWAQVAGNPLYWSVETEGFDTEPLTGRQLNSLGRIHALFNVATGEDYNRLADRPGERGIGTHHMGGAAWGGHDCPGTIRTGQRSEILKRAKRFEFRMGG